MSSSNQKMPYVRLGKSGLKVSRIILGTMQYGSSEWADWVLNVDQAIEHIKVAYDAGIQTFDTADIYSNGMSEVVLGKAIKKYAFPRDEIVVMTKIFFAVGKSPSELTHRLPDVDEVGYVNQHGLSRKHIFAAVKASLQRLQLDYIDLLQCHRFDNDTPIEETMQALHDVVQAGYVRYIGMSSCWAWQFHVMQNYAIVNRLTPFVSMQNHHNLLYREEEREMMPTLAHFGVGMIPWSPLASGALTRPLADQKTTTRGKSDSSVESYFGGGGSNDILKRVEEIAKKREISMAQVAIAWSLAKPGVTAPIVGTTSLTNLRDILGALHVKLTEEEITWLEEPYKAQSILGHR